MSNISIPALDSARVAWMLTFAAALVAAPATYGITSGTATSIDGLVSAASDAFDIGGTTNRIRNNPATFTVPNVSAKTDAINAALLACRTLAVQIQANAGISDADKLAAGVVPRNNTRTKVFVPATTPVLSIQFATPGVHTVNFADSTSPTLKAKPAGAVGLQIFIAIGDAPVSVPDTARFYGMFSKNPAVVAYDSADNGKIATMFGRWVGKRGDEGPWSLPESMTIAF